MTDPTGRCFLSYRRARADETALLIAAQHDHGIPTWQDVSNLRSVPTEDEIRSVLADPSVASAVLFITPEVEASPIIRNVEVPKIINRAEAADGFFVVPLAAGRLDYNEAAEITSNILSAQNLADWNMHKVTGTTLSPDDAGNIAYRVLVQRMQAIHRHLPRDHPLRIGLFVRRSPAFELGNALALDWSSRFTGKEATQETWRDMLLPALSRVADAVRKHAPNRQIEAFGIPTLPAALAFGCVFLSTGGFQVSWRQVTPGCPDQFWTIATAREQSGFEPRIASRDPNAQDIAVLVSVADNVESLFSTYQKELPPLRALVRVTKSGSYPHLVCSPGQAADIAYVVQDAMRTARREYGAIGTMHLFLAVPAGLAILVGQLLNTFGVVQTYEHVGTDGSGCYKPAALLHPCS
ncbi:MAG: SAVED domain-containing protein [Gammaproteobacteria bacterium]